MIIVSRQILSKLFYSQALFSQNLTCNLKTMFFFNYSSQQKKQIAENFEDFFFFIYMVIVSFFYIDTLLESKAMFEMIVFIKYDGIRPLELKSNALTNRDTR
jgi:hypothetical protein